MSVNQANNKLCLAPPLRVKFVLKLCYDRACLFCCCSSVYSTQYSIIAKVNLQHKLQGLLKADLSILGDTVWTYIPCNFTSGIHK